MFGLHLVDQRTSTRSDSLHTLGDICQWEDTFDYRDLKGASGIFWVEYRDVDQHATAQGQSPQQRILFCLYFLTPNARRANVEQRFCSFFEYFGYL